MRDFKTKLSASSTPDEEYTLELKNVASSGLKGMNIRIIGTIALIVLVCGYLAYLFTNSFRHHSAASSDHSVAKVSDSRSQEVYIYNMDEIITNISSKENNKRYLKLKIGLKFANSRDADTAQTHVDEINDSLIIFLKELRTEDLNGSGAALKLKEELMKRVNKVIYPVEARELLFREILVD